MLNIWWLPLWLRSKEYACNAETACNEGDTGLILDQEDPLEKETATHSSIIGWEIPWTEEPAGLQSMELQESDTT